MSRNENMNIKTPKLKKVESICKYFAKDFTAIQTAKKLGITRQTVNSYYKVLRDKLLEEFTFMDYLFLDKIYKNEHFNINYLNLYNTNIFFIDFENKIFILDCNKNIDFNLNNFINNKLKTPLSKHKKANSARILLNKENKSFLISGYLKNENSFEYFLQERLKQFRGISKDKICYYLKESQIRYNFEKEEIFQRVLNNFKLL